MLGKKLKTLCKKHIDPKTHFFTYWKFQINTKPDVRVNKETDNREKI